MHLFIFLLLKPETSRHSVGGGAFIAHWKEWPKGDNSATSELRLQD